MFSLHPHLKEKSHLIIKEKLGRIPVCTPFKKNPTLHSHLFLQWSPWFLTCVAISCVMCMHHVSSPMQPLRIMVQLSAHLTYMNHVKCICSVRSPQEKLAPTTNIIMHFSNTQDSHEHLFQTEGPKGFW